MLSNILYWRALHAVITFLGKHVADKWEFIPVTADDASYLGFSIGQTPNTVMQIEQLNISNE